MRASSTTAPTATIGFAPRITPEDFRSAFTAAEGWGSYRQERTDAAQTCALEVRRGRLALRTWSVTLPGRHVARGVMVRLDGGEVDAALLQDGARVTLALPEETVVEAGSVLEARLALRAAAGHRPTPPSGTGAHPASGSFPC